MRSKTSVTFTAHLPNDQFPFNENSEQSNIQQAGTVVYTVIKSRTPNKKKRKYNEMMASMLEQF